MAEANRISEEGGGGGSIMKRYVIYKFPSYLGTPREFSFKWMAYLYSVFVFLFSGRVCELEDRKTGEYGAFPKEL